MAGKRIHTDSNEGVDKALWRWFLDARLKKIPGEWATAV